MGSFWEAEVKVTDMPRSPKQSIRKSKLRSHRTKLYIFNGLYIWIKGDMANKIILTTWGDIEFVKLIYYLILK